MRTLLVLLLLAACTPDPKNTPCTNDGECTSKSSDFRYCAESRCVECVGRGSCNGKACVQGHCTDEAIPSSH